MLPLKTIIIDDEQNARENLKIILNDFCPDLSVVGEAGSADEARGLMKDLKPDLLFLDINMPKEDGFEFLDSLENKNISVIFVTAHNQFAMKALKIGAIDYIEKPIDIEELQVAVRKVIDSFSELSSTTDFGIIKQLLKEYKEESKAKTIAIPTLSGYEIIQAKEIVNLEADESYTKIFLQNGKKCVSSMTIAKYEKVLDSSTFFRVHKSHIVNIRYHLKEFNRHEGNVVIMDNGTVIPVARRKLSGFINAIKTF